MPLPRFARRQQRRRATRYEPHPGEAPWPTARYGSTMSKRRRIWVPIPKDATAGEAVRLIKEAADVAKASADNPEPGGEPESPAPISDNPARRQRHE